MRWVQHYVPEFELDLSGRIHRAIEEARASADAVTAARDTARVVIAAETAHAYRNGANAANHSALAVRRFGLPLHKGHSSSGT